MEDELGRELLETMKEIVKTITFQNQLIHDQLMPCFSIMTVLVKNMPPEEQKNLLATLQTVADDIEPLAQAENVESSYAKAAKIVSEIVSGGTDGIAAASVQRLQLIPGGKKDS